MTAVLDFIRAHAAWAPYLVFVVIFLKSLAFVSLVVPGISLIIGIGSLVAAAHLDFWSILFAVALGAALGDWVSYALGRRAAGRLDSIWPFKGRPSLVLRSERFFRHWGAFSIVLCRFVGPLRATVPILAGAFALTPWKFHLANWSSAVVWAAALLGPGQILVRWLD